MKKFILLMMLIMTPLVSFSQTDYPKIETDSSGHKIVIMTIEQAQKVDNNLEILKLLQYKVVSVIVLILLT